MATFVFGMNQSLDGYVDHDAFAPGPALFRHFVAQVEGQAGAVYGRTMYEIMRYWDEDQATWNDDERAFAAAWRRLPKWVVSRTLETVGPQATLVRGDVEATLRAIKTERDGEIEVAGPKLAHSLGGLGLIDAYRIYVHPVVVGRGTPLFAGAPPPLRLAAHERMADDVVRLTYVPAGARAAIEPAS